MIYVTKMKENTINCVINKQQITKHVAIKEFTLTICWQRDENRTLGLCFYTRTYRNEVSQVLFRDFFENENVYWNNYLVVFEQILMTRVCKALYFLFWVFRFSHGKYWKTYET